MIEPRKQLKSRSRYRCVGSRLYKQADMRGLGGSAGVGEHGEFHNGISSVPGRACDSSVGSMPYPRPIKPRTANGSQAVGAVYSTDEACESTGREGTAKRTVFLGEQGNCTGGTESLLTGLERIRQLAQSEPERKLQTLMHNVNMETLLAAHRAQETGSDFRWRMN